MITKRHIVDRAFAEIGLAGYMLDASPEEQQDALYQLDSMMAEWLSQSVDVSYILPTSPEDALLTEDSGLSMADINGVAKQLAVRLCPSYGKTPSPQLMVSAAQAKNALWVAHMTVPASRYPVTMPVGAGNRTYGVLVDRFYNAEPIDNTLPDA